MPKSERDLVAVEQARRADSDSGISNWAVAVASVKGIRTGEDGLKVQQQLREEWN